MNPSYLRSVTLSLFAALVLASSGISWGQALTVACPKSKTVECGISWDFDLPTATNSCCGTNFISIITNLTTIGSCSSIYTRFWMVSDCCTNYFCSQTVTVVDTTPPAITCASNKTLECGAPLNFDPPFAFDTCCHSNVFFHWLGSNVVSASQCQTVWAGRWQVSDCCSNYSAICTQRVTVADMLPPVISCPTGMVLSCDGANGRTVPFNVIAVDDCDPHPTIICTPASASFFATGTTWVNCTARDACGRSNYCSFPVTILDNCPSNSCITIECPPGKRLPCESVAGTLVDWTFTATNHCASNSLTTWSDPPAPALFDLGIHTVTCYASNSFGGEVRTCTFTVEIFPRAPHLEARRGSGPFGTNTLFIDYAQSCGEFAIQWIPSLGSAASGGGSSWSPISGLPTGSWDQPNQTNNIVERIIGFAIPDRGDPIPDASFFRLTSEVLTGKDFSSVPTGEYSNAIPTPPPWMTFSRIGGGAMQVANFSGTHALIVNDAGIVANFASNNATWPSRLYAPAMFHEVKFRVVGYINTTSPPSFFSKAFDAAGQLLDADMATNADSTVVLRSAGFPIARVEVKTEPDYMGGLVSLKGRTDYTPAIDQPLDCLNFRSYPVSTVVPNPWELPGHTISATNALGLAEPSTYIEAGPDGYGNGYHVNYATTIHLTTNCCRHIQVELIKYAGPVQVSAYNESGTELASHVVTQTATPYTVDFPPSTSPICKLVITAPDDQTRILSICCLPAIPPLSPPPFEQSATHANPWVSGPVTFQVSGGQLGSQLISVLPHLNFFVLDLGTETVATLATECNKVVLEVFSENANGGMELEAADQYGFVVARGGPLEANAAPQSVVLSAPGIKSVRLKCPGSQGYLNEIHGLSR